MLSRRILNLKEILVLIFVILIIGCICGILGYKFGSGEMQFYFSQSAHLSNTDLVNSLNIINHMYYKDIDRENLLQNTITTLVGSLNDPYSYYVNQNEYQQIINQDKGNFFGFGFTYRFENLTLKIIDVFPNSSAYDAGLKPNTIVESINGKKTSEFLNSTEIALFFKNIDFISLVIQSSDKPISISKKTYIVPTFLYQNSGNGKSYLKVYQFGDNVEKDFNQIKTQLQNDKPQKLIIDLRNNLGGQNDQVIYFVNQFLNQGIIMTEKIKDGNQSIVHKVDGKALFPDLKLIILTNHETSSGAEVATAALQENKRAVVVGEKTYGKGTTGQFFELNDKSAIHLSVGLWLTPNGNSIQDNGVLPDYPIKDEVINGQDQILTKALTL